MEYFCHKSTGYLRPTNYDWWMRLVVDPEIVRYYCWLSKTYGIEVEAGSRNGPHISVVKGEKLDKRFLNTWNNLNGKNIQFEYSNQLRDNGYHVWLDVRCHELNKIRQSLGLRPKPFHTLHLTIGRLKHNMGHKSHEPRPKRIKI